MRGKIGEGWLANRESIFFLNREGTGHDYVMLTGERLLRNEVFQPLKKQISTMASLSEDAEETLTEELKHGVDSLRVLLEKHLSNNDYD